MIMDHGGQVSPSASRAASSASSIPRTVQGGTGHAETGFPSVAGRLQRRYIGAGDAAVDQETARRDERRVVAGQEGDGGGDLFRLAEPAHRDVDQAAAG